MMQEIKFKGSEKFRAMAQIANALDGLDSEKEYVLTVKEYKKKRSLSANAYAWTLLDKLAERTGIAKTEIYKGLVKEIGGNSDLLVISNDAVQRFCNQWSSNGIGYVTEVMPNVRYPQFSNIRAYYGSSTYDTAQMSRLIDLIVQECKQQGIETMTPQEIAALMEAENEK